MRKNITKKDRSAEIKFQSNWKKTITILSCFVILGTISALTLPGITLNKYTCGIEEHIHSEECYTTSSEFNLVCTEKSLEVHRHTEDCYDEENNLTCDQVEFIVHSHDDNCYGVNDTLICTLPEVKEHQHTEECYKILETETEEKGEVEAILICEEPEIKLHTHNEECYVYDETSKEEMFVCTEFEVKEHQHSDSCFKQGEPILTCSLEEHQHMEECKNQEEVKEDPLTGELKDEEFLDAEKKEEKQTDESDDSAESVITAEEDNPQKQILTIGKELEFTGGEFTQEQLADSKNRLSYMFRVVGTDGNSLFSSQDIQIIDESQTTHADENGWFELKVGQRVQFTDIVEKAVLAEVTEYYVEEAIPESYRSQYGEITYTDGISDEKVVVKGQESAGYVIYKTSKLSLENSYSIIYTGKVNVEKMSYLQISNNILEGSDLKEDDVFEIMITLGDRPVSAGTEFKMKDSEEIITADDNGSILLKGDQTVQMATPILAGTQYSVSERAKEGWQIENYTLTYTDVEQLEIYKDKVFAEIPTNTVAKVNIFNRSYNFKVDIPVSVQFEGINLDNLEAKRSSIVSVTQVGDENGTELGEQEVMIAPVDSEITFTCIGEKVEKEQVVVGFSPEAAAGVYYYMIKEESSSSDLDEQFENDRSIYVAEVTVKENKAEITAMYKNGETMEKDSEGIFTAAFINPLSIVELPATGGIGTDSYMFSGLVLIGVAALLYIIKRKKEGNETHETF